MTRALRPDLDLKLRGGVEFGTDLASPEMMWGVLVLSPIAHGRIRSVDLSAARARPGVVAISSADLSALVGGALGDAERPPFPKERISYPAQPLAAIAAPTLEEARA
ncbi:MAG: hypothetical protein WBG19_10330, partial [Thermoplasmata archaeon]